MFLRHNVKSIVKCKITKFIKVPIIIAHKKSKIPQCNTDSSHPLPMYAIIRSNHQTFFYARNNSIYFYEGLLNRDEKIVPFYDYKTERYHLTKLAYANTGLIKSIISHFKAANGDTYFIYLTKQKNGSEPDIVVYNYTKNKIIYRKEFKWLDKLTFTIPIANSLIVSLSPSDDDIWIRIIDVTKEDESEVVKFFMVSLTQYFIDIAHFMSDKISKRDVIRLEKIARKMINGYTSTEYSQDYKTIITAGIHDNNVVFYKGFEIQFSKIRLKSLNTVMEEAFSLSFVLEDDNIVIQVGTGNKGLIKINRNLINIPPNEYWTVAKCELNSEYNLSRSQLYSVSKVSKNYMIIDSVMYYLYPNMPKNYKCYDWHRKIWHIFDDNDISILRVRDAYLVCLNLLYSKTNYKPVIHITSRLSILIYVIKINKLKNKIKQMQRDKNDEFPDIVELSEDLVENLEIEGKVSEFLSDIYGIKPSNDSYKYRYYIDEENGYMYCLVLYETINGYKDAIILKYYLENNKMQPTIIAYSKIKSDELKNNKNLLKAKVINLTAYQSIGKLQLVKLLENYAQKLSYNYANEIIIEIRYPLFLFSDIKYNRDKSLRYFGDYFKEISYVDRERRYNIVKWRIYGNIGKSNKNIDVPFIISELIVTRKLSFVSKLEN
jgi:hypothetical protein